MKQLGFCLLIVLMIHCVACNRHVKHERRSERVAKFANQLTDVRKQYLDYKAAAEIRRGEEAKHRQHISSRAQHYSAERANKALSRHTLSSFVRLTNASVAGHRRPLLFAANKFQKSTASRSHSLASSLSSSLSNGNSSAFFLPKVRFLKSWKTGSTTVQRMLMRHCWQTRKLAAMSDDIVYMTAKSTWYPGEVSLQHLHPPKPIKYVKRLYEQLVPSTSTSASMSGGDDIVWLTVVREPRHRLVSSLLYYKPPPPEMIGDDEALLRYIDAKLPSMSKALLPVSDWTLAALVREFDPLVLLVLERFDESLVMMAMQLGWPLTDVLYVATNQCDHKRGFDGMHVPCPPDAAFDETRRAGAPVGRANERALYVEANRRLGVFIAAHRALFARNLATLQAMLRRVHTTCSSSSSSSDASSESTSSGDDEAAPLHRWPDDFEQWSVADHLALCRYFSMREREALKFALHRRARDEREHGADLSQLYAPIKH
jgi:hypothetical protein